MYTNRSITNFHLDCFSVSPLRNFYRFVFLSTNFRNVFIGQHSRHIIFQYSSLYYSRTYSIFCFLSFCLLVLRFHTACMPFSRCFPLCLRLGTLAPSSRWNLEPTNELIASTARFSPFFANFFYSQSNLTFHLTLYFPKFQSMNTSTSAHNPRISLRSALSSLTFPKVLFTFNFPKSKFFRDPTQMTLFHTPPSWAPLNNV